MLGYAAVTLALILPMTLFALAPAPESRCTAARRPATRKPARVLGLPPNAAQALLCLAGFLCCVPMAMPSSHLVAFCSDLGIAPDAGRGDAVGHARLRVRVTAVLGLVRRPLRRVARRAGRLRLPGGRDRLLRADAERGRLVRRRRRLRAGLLRHHPVLRAGRPRVVPLIRGGVARADAAVYRDVRHGVSEAGWPARCTIISATTRRRSAPAWCSTSAIWWWSGMLVLRHQRGQRLSFAAAE